MIGKKILAILCATVLLAAVSVAPVSAASASGQTSGGSIGILFTTATLTAAPTSGQALTRPVMEEYPANPTTVVNIRCVSNTTGVERWMSDEGDDSATAVSPDSYSRGQFHPHIR